MLIPSAYAQAAGATSAAPDPAAGIISFAPFILIFVAFYFLMIRPQSKRAKALRDTLSAIRKNDQVITSGGILGKVTKVADPYIEVEIAANTRIQVVRSTIVEVVAPTSAKPAND